MSDVLSSQSSTLSTQSPFLRISSPSAVKPPSEFKYKGRKWMRIEHQDSKRAGTKVSIIWDKGSEYIDIQDPEGSHSWRCNLCPRDTIYNVGKVRKYITSGPRRHLARIHKIIIQGDDDLDPNDILEEEERGPSEVTSLTTVFKIDKFRRCLLRWVINRQHSLIEVEDKDFRAMLRSLNDRVKGYIPGADTLRNWIDQEVAESFYQVVDVLQEAKSRIHISFDLWSSPNGYAICGVVAHFIDVAWVNRQVLLALKKMSARHTGEEIAAVIVPVLREYGIANKIGVFVCDNIDSNDRAIHRILDDLDINDYIENRRSRCLGHIINLVAKAFIFGRNTEAFEATANAVTESTPYDSEIMRQSQIAWRTRGPVGKLHNIIVFIRSSPQRRAAFGRLLTGDDKVDGKSFILLLEVPL